jgi:hypothetical protein
MQGTKLDSSRLFFKMKLATATIGVQSSYSQESIDKLLVAGIEMLKTHHKEDSDYFKLRKLKGIVNDREVWMIEDSQAVTLLLPEEY